MADPNMGRKEAEIDEDGGVAVLFDDEDQEDEEEENYEIRDDTDEEDERDEREGEEMAREGEVQEEDIVIGGEASQTATSKAERDVCFSSLH
jgi:pre-mRNA-splicing helicase BRR2